MVILCITKRLESALYYQERRDRNGWMFYSWLATKLVTSIAFQCVEDGLLTHDGDISSIVPELGIKQVIKGFAEDDKTPILEPAKRAITLKMLLTQRWHCIRFLGPSRRKMA